MSEEFIWIYTLYKIGGAAGIVGFFGVIGAFACLAVRIECIGTPNSEKMKKWLIGGAVVLFTLSVLCLAVAAATPHDSEIQKYIKLKGIDEHNTGGA